MNRHALAILSVVVTMLQVFENAAFSQATLPISEIARFENDIFNDSRLDATFRAAAIRPPWLYALDREGDLYVFKFPDSFVPEFAAGFVDQVLNRHGHPDARLTDEDIQPLSLVRKLKAVGDGQDLAVCSNALLLTFKGQLKAFDLSEPSNPKSMGAFGPESSRFSNSLVEGNGIAFVLSDDVISAFDLSNPTEPRFLGSLKNGRGNWNGCYDGHRLYVTEIQSRPKNRTGITVYDASNPQALAELHYVETARAAYHVFVNRENFLLACLDSKSLIHSVSLDNITVDGSTQIFELNEKRGPNSIAVIDNSGGRLACMASYRGATYFFFEGLVYVTENDSMKKVHSFFPQTSTLDGCPYSGDAAGRYVAIAGDDSISVFRIAESEGFSSGKWVAQALWFLLLQQL